MTASELRALVTSKIEDQTVPNRVMEWVRKNAGKGLRKNNLPEGATISFRFGMTHLVFPKKADEYTDYLLSHRTVNVIIPDVAELRRLNSCWYEGLEERNKIRREFLGNEEMTGRASRMIQDCVRLKQAYLNILEMMNKHFLDHQKPLSPDSYEIRKLVEIEKKR